ncbi:MAG: ABC transporter ATP-binding protein, partial [bacterium]
DILTPDAVEIRVLGEPMAPKLKDIVSYLPEERGLYQKQKVVDVLAYLAELKGIAPYEARTRAFDWLDKIQMPEVKTKRVNELSKGMQQKIQFASVFISRPKVAIMDEPFSGLDPVNRRLLIDLLKDEAMRGTAVLLSTHQMEQVEALCERVLLIDKGKRILYGAVREIKEKYYDNSIRVALRADGAMTEAEGLNALLGLPAVAVAKRAGGNHTYKVGLKDGVAPEQFVMSLMEVGLRLESFERALPSMDDVFVKAVEGDARS